jgi:hypothetical protein
LNNITHIAIPDPHDPVELSFAIRLVIERYVATRGNNPLTQIEVLGAVDAARVDVYLMPSKLPGAHQ